MSGYDTPTARFTEVQAYDFTDIYSYTNETAFLNEVDLSVPGVIMDCGECHVGGAGMEYVPNGDLDARTSLRNIDDAGIMINGSTVANPVVSGDYTSFNYFIDIYDANNNGNEAEALLMDYDDTGVMEMDCLICHMDGYDYLERTEMLREARIDASRAIGAKFAHVAHDETTGNSLPAFGTADFGRTVTYDMAQFEEHGTNGGMVIPENWSRDYLVKTPDSVNCAFCHMNAPTVDWKKRGDNWAPDGEWDYTYEVHYNIGCMGCHQRKPTAAVTEMDGTVVTPAQGAADEYLSVGPTDPADPWYNPASNYPVMGQNLLGHDPAKGGAPFSGLYNKNDWSAFKDCVDCHAKQGDGGSDFGAPDPEAAHRAAGLMDRIVQAGAMDGTMEVTHIDLIECSSCHSRKINSYDWGNTGNPLVDATGNDLEGRMTDHENHSIIKTDMTDRSSLGWDKFGRLIRVAYLNTMFYRDFGGNVSYDANRDGRGGGMDPVLTTHVNNVNDLAANQWTSLTADNYNETTGVSTVSGADIQERFDAIDAYLGGAADTRLSMMHVAFRDQHGVSPAKYAWGSGLGNDPFDNPISPAQSGCLDCHDAAGNFYNGSVNTYGDNLNISWNSGQVVPYTKTNGASQGTDMHPNVKDRFQVRSLAAVASTGGTGPREISRAETLYEANFMTRAPFAASYVGVAPPSFGGVEAGWLFMVEARSTAVQQGAEILGDNPLTTTVVETDFPTGTYEQIPVGTITKRTRSLPSGTNVTDIAGLFGALGTTFTSGQPEFTITNNGTGLTITANADFEIRLMGGVDNANDFGLIGAAYVADSWTTVTGEVIDNRTDWVSYLNSIGSLNAAADLGLGVAPTAAFDSSVPSVVYLDETTGEVTVTLTPDKTSNDVGNYTYLWWCDGAQLAKDTADVATKTFNYQGFYPVVLRVINSEGQVALAQRNIEVRLPVPASDFSYSTLLDQLTVDNLALGYDRLYVNYGDGSEETFSAGDGTLNVALTTQVLDHVYDLTPTDMGAVPPVYNPNDRGDYFEFSVRVITYDALYDVVEEKTAQVIIPKTP